MMSEFVKNLESAGLALVAASAEADTDEIETEARLAALEARVAKLEVPAPPVEPPVEPPAPGPGAELWWNDALNEMPKEAPGRYLFSGRRPAGSLEMTDFLGERCLRIRIRSNQRDENDRCRTEIGFWDVAKPNAKIFERIPFRQTRWFHFEWAVDTSWFLDGHKRHFGQWHSTPDAADGPGRSGPLDFAIVRDEIRFRRLWDDRKTSPAGPTNLLVTKVADLVPDTWYPWTVQANFDWRKAADGGVGFTKVWLGEKLVFDEDGPNCYNDAEGNYFRFGCYFPQAIEPGYPQDKVWDFFVRNVRLGGPEHALKDLL